MATWKARSSVRLLFSRRRTFAIWSESRFRPSMITPALWIGLRLRREQIAKVAETPERQIPANVIEARNRDWPRSATALPRRHAQRATVSRTSVMGKDRDDLLRGLCRTESLLLYDNGRSFAREKESARSGDIVRYGTVYRSESSNSINGQKGGQHDSSRSKRRWRWRRWRLGRAKGALHLALVQGRSASPPQAQLKPTLHHRWHRSRASTRTFAMLPSR
jgi:hypothetical protein